VLEKLRGAVDTGVDSSIFHINHTVCLFFTITDLAGSIWRPELEWAKGDVLAALSIAHLFSPLYDEVPSIEAPNATAVTGVFLTFLCGIR
jgi:hypothetical protein